MLAGGLWDAWKELETISAQVKLTIRWWRLHIITHRKAFPKCQNDFKMKLRGTSQKNGGQFIFHFGTDTHRCLTHAQAAGEMKRADYNWTLRVCVCFSCFYLAASDRKKKKKRVLRLVPLKIQKIYFFFNLKANLTERFVQQRRNTCRVMQENTQSKLSLRVPVCTCI